MGLHEKRLHLVRAILLKNVIIAPILSYQSLTTFTFSKNEYGPVHHVGRGCLIRWQVWNGVVAEVDRSGHCWWEKKNRKTCVS